MTRILFAVSVATLHAEEKDPLPDPLTLKAALQSIDDTHPLIADALAIKDSAAANLQATQSSDDFTLDLSLQARQIDPSEHALLRERDDSRATLTLHKTLYDFGRTGHRVTADEELLLSRKTTLSLARQKQRRQIMRRFFEVVLSDLQYAAATEDGAIAFVRADNAKERLSLGEISDIDWLKLQSINQEKLMIRIRAEDAQRQTRAQLALEMNRPGDLVDMMEPPSLPGIKNQLPEYDALLEEMEQNNLLLKALAEERRASLEGKKSAQSEGRPEIFLQLEAAEYRRESSFRDPFTAILGLDVPLYRGGRTRSQVAQSNAEIGQLDAQTQRDRYQLQQELLETWLAINTLQRQLEQAAVQREYRDLELDRNRARYELEMDTNFGDAMTQQSAAKLFTEKTRFELALAREKLVELTQNPDYSATQPAAPKAPEETP